MAKGKLVTSGENELAGKIRDAIGVGPDEEVTVMTPQFERTASQPIPAQSSKDSEWWEALKGMSIIALKEMGCSQWNDLEDPDSKDVERFGLGGILMLFPGEWYSDIPRDFEIVTILGKKEFFTPESDENIRFGCLSYGLVVK